MPRRLFASLKPFYEAFRTRIRRQRVRKLVAQLRSIERRSDAVMPIVTRLREVWGNDSYTADLGFLAEMVERTLTTRGPFLDCGSGISTVILGAITAGSDDSVWSLEQDEVWCREMRVELRRLGLPHVQLLHAPLEITGTAAWYTIDRSDFPRNFPLIICDGPAIRRSLWPPDVFQSWRVGVVEALRKRGVSFETIVLDDADDRRCGTLIDTWRNAGLAVEIVETITGRHVVAHNVGSIGENPTKAVLA